MLRLAREHAVQDLSSFLFPGVALVMRHHPGCDKGQRIEHAGFIVCGIALVKLLHRIAISKGARAVIDLVSVFIKNFYGSKVILFALSPRAGRFSLFDCTRSFAQLRLSWW